MPSKPTPPSGPSRAANVINLLVTTVSLLAFIAISGLAGSGNPEKYGFKNNTGVVSDRFGTQVTPAGFTFIIWAVIYLWQVAWVGYAWSFTCRPKAIVTIFSGAYPAYSLTCFINITWLYTWGNYLDNVSGPLLVLFNVVMYPIIGSVAVYLSRVSSYASDNDVKLTRALPLNGLCFYATWTTIASLINICVILQYTFDVAADNAGTIVLGVLTLALVAYFLLDNFVLQQYLQYVFSVYPVVIWALIGVLAKHLGDADSKRNNIISGVLLVVAIALAGVKLALFAKKSCFRAGRVNTPKETN